MSGYPKTACFPWPSPSCLSPDSLPRNIVNEDGIFWRPHERLKPSFDLESWIILMELFHMRTLVVNQCASYPEMRILMPFCPWILCQPLCFLGWGEHWGVFLGETWNRELLLQWVYGDLILLSFNLRQLEGKAHGFARIWMTAVRVTLNLCFPK